MNRLFVAAAIAASSCAHAWAEPETLQKLKALRELRETALAKASGAAVAAPPAPKPAAVGNSGGVRGFNYKRAAELFESARAKRVDLKDLKKLEGAWRLDAQVSAHAIEGIYSPEGLRWYREEERRLIIASGYHPYEERLRIEAKGRNLYAGELSGASPSECEFKDGALACSIPLVDENFNLSCRLIGAGRLLCRESIINYETGYMAFSKVKK